MTRKRFGKSLIATSLAICMLFGTVPSYVQAEGSETQVVIADDRISIGNDYISREYSVDENGKIQTSIVSNKRINTTIEPQEGSQDFAMNAIATSGIEESNDAIVNEGYYSTKDFLETDGWSATLKNHVTYKFADDQVANLFDNDLNTIVDNYKIAGNPFTLDIDFGSVQTLSGMYVDKRPGYSNSKYGINGTMGGYEIWTSANGEEYTLYMTGEFTAEDYALHEADGLYNVGERVYAEFASAIETRYIRVVQTSVALGTSEEFASAEVGFYNGEKSNTLSQTDWTASLRRESSATFDAEQTANLFDGDTNTIVDQNSITGHDFILDIDFGAVQTISGMSVNKRPGFTDARYGTNGTMGIYEVLTSEDGIKYTSLKQGEFTEADYNLHTEGNLHNVGDTVYADFGTDAETRYVRVVQKSVAMGNAQEFTSAEVDFYYENQQAQAPVKALDRSNWDVTITNGTGTAFGDTHVNYLIDGNLNTNPDEYKKSGHPFYVDIDLGEEKTIRSLSVDKRPGYGDQRYGINGTMGRFELYVSADGENWEIAGAGEFTEAAYNLHQVGNLYNVGDRVYANFYKPYTTRYVRVVQLSTSMGTADEFTTAELNLFEDQYYGPNWNTNPVIKEEMELCSGDLTFKSAEASDIEGGKKLTISYEPYVLNETEITVKQVVVLEDDDPYMRSFIEIDVPEDQRENLTIDYIDTDRFVLPEDAEGLWTHPDVSQISSGLMIGKFEFVLGQPIYANGFYMGSEFPSTDTQIVDGTTQVRYYSGKNFTKLEDDNQLTTDGKFVTWQNVIGAATGTDTATVQTDFFAYIEEIATPTEFRKQYNSWYDNMMNITDESIKKSFLGTEANLSANGVEPLASYVMDDGWINYYSVIGDTTYVNPSSTAGSITPNRTGFWEFNNKFPNELYTATALADKLNATFGLWVGPRGGYNHNAGFGRFMEASGTGYYASTTNDICVASKRYTENLKALFVDYEKRFDIDYWKWDGFATKPCTNANHDHMTGGYNNMYYTSDLWEHWIDVFEAARAARAEEGKGLFINATCYTNLSPWLLQWVNTVWTQTGADTGQLGTGERHEQKIYFRDQVYYKMYVQNQVQFPINHVYNHDPIYGVSDNSSATTEVFREFLFANAMRGTAFWELYFSPSIFDDAKWKVTADALAWAEENHEVLKNAKYYGSDPAKGVYGFSCWNGDEGIVSFVNPLATEATYSLVMDEAVGVRETVSGLTGIQVEPYAVGTLEGTLSYGDTVEVTLQPHETRIYHYGHEDNEAPVIVSAKATGANEITVKFDERVQLGTFTVNGAEAAAELKEDYRTVVLTTAEEVEKENNVEVKGITDFGGNKKEETLFVTYYKDDVIAYVNTSAELADGEAVESSYDALADVLWMKNMAQAYTIDTENVLKGTTDFTVTLNVKTTDADVTLFNSNDEVTLSINEEGFVEFKVGSLTVASKEEVITVVEKAHGTFGTEEYVPTSTETAIRGAVNDGNAHSITAVREANGMIKLYIDGELSGSAYDEAYINEELIGGKMTVADTGFTGQLANVQILNKALKYNESAAKIESSLKDILSDHEGWTAAACSEMDGTANTGGDKDAAAAIDGDVETRWHTNYNGEDSCEAGTHWIQINFNREESFDKVHYTSRGPGFNGSIKDYMLELLDEDGQVTATFTGAFSSSSGKDVVTLDKVYQAYGMRLTAVSTHNGKDFAAADEINISITDTLVEGEDLQAEIARLLAKTEGIEYEDYTTETANVLKNVVEKISNLESAGVENLKALETELDAAIAALEETAKLEVCEIFEDVTHDAWYEASVQYVYDNGIMSGNNGLFNPAGNITRAQVVATLYKLEGEPEITDFSVCNRFTDVDQSAWYAAAVSWACEAGVASGNTATAKFNPGDPVTRQQLAVFFYKYAEYKGLDITTRGDYSDLAGADEVSSYAADMMQWAYGTGLITGSAATGADGVTVYNLNPKGTATRAQMASILQRFCEANHL